MVVRFWRREEVWKMLRRALGGRRTARLSMFWGLGLRGVCAWRGVRGGGEMQANVVVNGGLEGVGDVRVEGCRVCLFGWR